MSELLSQLNQEQKEAIIHTAGPLLIVAGPGTGKTTVIVEKIKHLILNNFARPEEILALTFTEKAAIEMEERVDKAMPYGYFQMWISTFHAFADRTLREDGYHIGLDLGYKLLTQAETILFLRSKLFLFNLKYFRPLSNPQKFLDALLQHFSRIRDEDISPEEYMQWFVAQQQDAEKTPEEKEKILELVQAYHTYQEIKIREGYFDFSDLIYHLLKLLRARPALLKQYQQQFKYVLVDEFQDTNIAQYLLLKLLCPPELKPNLTVVGDDSQAVYKFRGASVSNILTFMQDYKRAKEITLIKNYRSYQDILDASHRLIKNNDPDTLEAQLDISKKLIAARGNHIDTIHLSIAENGNDEAEHVVKTILALKQKQSYHFSDFAILVRANNHADPFISTLIRNGVPYKFLGPGMLFKQPEVKDLIAYLKVLYNIEDSVALYRVLLMDIFQLDARDIHLLLSCAKKVSVSLFQTIEIYLSFINQELYKEEYEIYRKFLPLLSEETKKTLYKLYSMMRRHLGLVKKNTAGQILYYFLEDTGYLKELTTVTSILQEKIALNVTKFFNKLKSYENEHEDASVFAVVDYIDMSLELGESPPAEDTDNTSYDAVQIMTLHGAKGLEFPVVFLVNLTMGRFPSYQRKEPLPIPNELIKEILPQGDYHLQEERRLFYVGLTRAQNQVYLSVSRAYGEGKRERKISPFVVETVGIDTVNKYERLKKEEKIQLSIFDFKNTESSIVRKKPTLSNFSFSQLETFTLCPLQYKYQYLLKIPTMVSAAASFGDSIHRTLQKFYQEYLTDPLLNQKRLLEIYRQSWIPAGYTSSTHEKKMRKEGEEMLTKYFKTFHLKDIAIIALEKFFKIKLPNETFIVGKIDRIDQKENGAIEIIDYKTGKKPEEKELKKNLQLSIYALAAIDTGLYGKKLEDVHLTFYYLQDMERISMQKTEDDMDTVKKQITNLVEQIRGDTFQPRVGPWCSFCSFKMICEAWQ